MKNKKITLIMLIVITILSVACSKNEKTELEGEGKLKIYTSIYPIYDFTTKIGGDKVVVNNLVPAGTEPHDFELSTSDLVNLEKADMLIYNGAGIESWSDKVINSLENENIIYVKSSQGLNIHKVDSNEEKSSHTHSHGSTDPHTWLNIKNAKKEMENIKDALVKKDPQNAQYYENNFKTYAKKFDELDGKYKETLANIPDKSIIVAHEAFGYLCDEYDIKQVAIEGLTPDSEPDPARMSKIIKFAKENNIKTIFFEELVSPKVAKTIAKEVGAKTEVLNPLEGLSEEDIKNNKDYFSVMEENLKVIYDSLKK